MALVNRPHLQLSNVYEKYFAKLRSPIALRFLSPLPAAARPGGHDATMLGGLLLDLAGGRVGPHKGGKRLLILREKAQGILSTSAELRTATLALELKAELIRQLCDELIAIHERIGQLVRMLRDRLLPATGQTITTIPGIGNILAAVILGETGSISRLRSPAVFAVHNGTAPTRNSTGARPAQGAV